MNKITLSNSRLGSFWSCEQKYFWTYIRNLVPKGHESYFSLGSMYHTGLNTLLAPINQVMHEKERLDLAIETIERQSRDEHHDVEDKKLAMNYVIIYAKSDLLRNTLQEFDILSVEQWLETQIDEIDGIPIYAMSKSDGILMHKHNRSLWILEHKTARALSAPYASSFTDGAQIAQYGFVTRDLLRKPVMGVKFHFMLKQKSPRVELIEALIDDEKLRRWKTTAIRSARRMHDLGKGAEPIQNLNGCNYYNQECRYKTLCQHGEEQGKVFYKKREELKIMDGGIKR